LNKFNNNEFVKEIDKLFQDIIKKISSETNKLLPENMTSSQFFLLKFIYCHEKCKAADIAKNLCISPAAVTNIVDRLYKNNWIEKVRSDKDRRIVWLKLSKKGKELYLKAREKKYELLAEILNNITFEEMYLLKNILTKIADNLSDTQKDK